jgi:ArsR family transcriptional regulator, arsenate/arsenite/antimonite-responsive transcriptional repressor
MAIPMAKINGDLLTSRREERQMTKVFKALSDGTRQEILRLLEENQRTVGEIVGNFNLSQPTISRHLSVLKEADLVVDQRQGQNVIYRLNDGRSPPPCGSSSASSRAASSAPCAEARRGFTGPEPAAVSRRVGLRSRAPGLAPRAVSGYIPFARPRTRSRGASRPRSGGVAQGLERTAHNR